MASPGDRIEITHGCILQCLILNTHQILLNSKSSLKFHGQFGWLWGNTTGSQGRVMTDRWNDVCGGDTRSIPQENQSSRLMQHINWKFHLLMIMMNNNTCVCACDLFAPLIVRQAWMGIIQWRRCWYAHYGSTCQNKKGVHSLFLPRSLSLSLSLRSPRRLISSISLMLQTLRCILWWLQLVVIMYF